MTDPKEQWGPWTLDTETMTLDFGSTQPRWQHLNYEIDLASINTSAQMLDWIFQIRGKPWADAHTLKSLLDAFNSIFMPQWKLCSGGWDHRIDAKEMLRHRFASEEVT